MQIFSSGPPSRPYVDVAYLEAEQQTGYSLDDTPEFFQQLRERAGQMGCDGVVVGNITHRADAFTSVTADVNASRKGLTATCIMYVDDAIASTPPPPHALPPPPQSPAVPPAQAASAPSGPAPGARP